MFLDLYGNKWDLVQPRARRIESEGVGYSSGRRSERWRQRRMRPIVGSIESEYRRYRRLGDAAIAQLDDAHPTLEKAPRADARPHTP